MKWAIYGDDESTAAFNPRTAKAFCEGRKAQIDGVSILGNPFVPGIEDENGVAWTEGWNAAANAFDKGYCAV